MMLSPGDPAPDFTCPSSVNPQFHFDTVAGRYVVLCFFASTKHEPSARLLQEVSRRKGRFDVTNLVFFGVSVDPADAETLKQETPGIMYFWDTDMAVSRMYGAMETGEATAAKPAPASHADPYRALPDDALEADAGHSPQSAAADALAGNMTYGLRTIILDQALRVIAIVRVASEPTAHVNEVFRILDELPKLDTLQIPVPVLLLPYVFEPDLCRTLIEYYRQKGGLDSGFMRDVGGKTVGLLDYSHKRRADCDIEEQELIAVTHDRLRRRVVPAIRQAFQFAVTRVERNIVACYDSAEGGHFKAHRDNTTLGTAHRRFAVTINLNAEEYEGGDLWFPEFGRRRYRASTGGAVVFSCSLLHEATPVTHQKRLRDDLGAR